jgi:hypothetical protein
MILRNLKTNKVFTQKIFSGNKRKKHQIKLQVGLNKSEEYELVVYLSSKFPLLPSFLSMRSDWNIE